MSFAEKGVCSLLQPILHLQSPNQALGLCPIAQHTAICKLHLAALPSQFIKEHLSLYCSKEKGILHRFCPLSEIFSDGQRPR